MHAPVGDLVGHGRVRDVDQPEVALALLVAATAGRCGVRVLAGRDAGEHEAAVQVGPVLDLQLMQAARTAAGAQQRELPRLRRGRDVEHLQAAEEARVVARAAADLDARHRDVAAGAGVGVDHDVLDRGAGRVLQLGDHARLGGVPRVEHGNPALVRRRAEARLRPRRVVGEPPRADVRVLLVDPHVGVEAAAPDVVGADGHHVPRRALCLGALRVDPLDRPRRLPDMRRCRHRAAEREHRAGGRTGRPSPRPHLAPWKFDSGPIAGRCADSTTAAPPVKP